MEKPTDRLSILIGEKGLTRLAAAKKLSGSIRLVGGAARSKVWSRIFADVCAIPVKTVLSKDPGALGAAMSAAVASGFYSDYEEAARKMVRFNDVILPDMAAHKIYLSKFEKYKAAAGR